jgi:hypothetical protein
MKIISALIIGFLSGCLVHMLVAMVFLQHAPIEHFLQPCVLSAGRLVSDDACSLPRCGIRLTGMGQGGGDRGS